MKSFIVISLLFYGWLFMETSGMIMTVMRLH